MRRFSRNEVPLNPVLCGGSVFLQTKKWQKEHLRPGATALARANRSLAVKSGDELSSQAVEQGKR